MKSIKSVLSLLVLALCLCGCSKGVDKPKQDELQTNQTHDVNEIINNEEEQTKEEVKQDTVSFSESVNDESSKSEDKTDKKENNQSTVKPSTNKDQTSQKPSNDKKDEEVKKEDVKVEDKETSKPVETVPTVPKEEPKEPDVPNVEEKEEVVVKAYLSRDTLNYINKEREKIGLSPLKWDSSLENAVLTRAKETDQNYSHTRPNGSKWTTVLPNKDSMQLYGEIITNRFNPYDAVQAWMNSPSHKESMLDPDKTHGVVAVYNDVYVCITVKYFD